MEWFNGRTAVHQAHSPEYKPQHQNNNKLLSSKLLELSSHPVLPKKKKFMMNHTFVQAAIAMVRTPTVVTYNVHGIYEHGLG
jgi:hypothetical protein